MSRITTLSFDCYGTLVQWPETVSALLYVTAQRHGASPPPPELLSRFRSHHSKLLRGPYRPYRALLVDAQRRALAHWGVQADYDDEAHLLAGLRAIPPYPDVPRALAELANHYRIVIISNTENDLIANTIAGLGAEPDTVITAEQARAYKPSGAMWDFVLTHVGCARHEFVHVAAGLPTDISPALSAGLRAVWVNRVGSRHDAPAVDSISTLTELLPLLKRGVRELLT